MITHLYTVCWNEADMLPWFFRHYDPWVDRYFIYDDGSDDGSLEILRAHPKVEVRRFEWTDPESFVLSHRKFHNQAWRESRDVADWVVVTALDEHVFVRGRPMHRYLFEQKVTGVTMLPAFGFDTISDAFPEGEVRLVDVPVRTVASKMFNKLSIFNPSALTIDFNVGRHRVVPDGRILMPRTDEQLLFHYKRVGYERTRDRQRAQGERLGSTDRSSGYGVHYTWNEAEFRAEWDDRTGRAFDTREIPEDAGEAAEGPLWWAEYPRV